MFSSIIDGNENSLSLIDNGSETEILNESFAQQKKLEIVKLKKKDRVRLVLGDGSSSQILKRAATIDLRIGDHREGLFCYLGKIEDCTLILGDGWLQKHNPKIDWKNITMRFSKKCVQLGCLNQKKTVTAFETGNTEELNVDQSSAETLLEANSESESTDATLVDNDPEPEATSTRRFYQANSTKKTFKLSIPRDF